MKNCAIKSGAQAANLFLGFSWNWRKEIDFSSVIGEKWKKEKKLKLLFILYIGKKLWWKWFFFLLFLRIYFFLGKRETRFEWSLTWHLSESLWKIIWGLYVLKEIRFLKDNLGKTPAISVGKKKKKEKGSINDRQRHISLLYFIHWFSIQCLRHTNSCHTAFIRHQQDYSLFDGISARFLSIIRGKNFSKFDDDDDDDVCLGWNEIF